MGYINVVAKAYKILKFIQSIKHKSTKQIDT